MQNYKFVACSRTLFKVRLFVFLKPQKFFPVCKHQNKLLVVIKSSKFQKVFANLTYKYFGIPNLKAITYDSNLPFFTNLSIGM